MVSLGDRPIAVLHTWRQFMMHVEEQRPLPRDKLGQNEPEVPQ